MFGRWRNYILFLYFQWSWARVALDCYSYNGLRDWLAGVGVADQGAEMTEALDAEAGRIEARIARLEKERRCWLAVVDFCMPEAQDQVRQRIDDIGDELGPLERALDEIEESLGWAEAKEERRNAPIIL
jgi:hypothetical protein